MNEFDRNDFNNENENKNTAANETDAHKANEEISFSEGGVNKKTPSETVSENRYGADKNEESCQFGTAERETVSRREYESRERQNTNNWSPPQMSDRPMQQNPQHNPQLHENNQIPQNRGYNPYHQAQQNGGYWSNQQPQPQGYRPYDGQNNAGREYRQGYNGNQISYTPVPQPKKKSTSLSRSGFAVGCVIAILLSGCFGFGGAYLANRITAPEKGSSVSVGANGSLSSQSGGENVTVYRDYTEVVTSVGTGDELTYSQVAEIVKNSVVEITTEFKSQSMWYQYTTQGAGSGVIISTDGYIITNAHVITDESSGAVADNIKVRLNDGTEYSATSVGYDSDGDIAVLKIEANNLTPAVCGDSDKLVVGEELIVVGNPLGELGGSVTNGIVSATEREISVNGVMMRLIQTNAAVNPGNSGGGMFNMKGQLVGIINAKSSGSDIEGLGFAIPINEALSISEQLLEYGYVRGKPAIGVTFTNITGTNYLFYYNMKSGVYVEYLAPGFNDKVLKVGDRVIAVNGSEVTSSSEIKEVVTSSKVGDVLEFQLYRDGKLTEVDVTVYERVPEMTSSSEIEFESNADIKDGFSEGGKTYYFPDGGKTYVPKN